MWTQEVLFKNQIFVLRSNLQFPVNTQWLEFWGLNEDHCREVKHISKPIGGTPNISARFEGVWHWVKERDISYHGSYSSCCQRPPNVPGNRCHSGTGVVGDCWSNIGRVRELSLARVFLNLF
ncbi:hypothetical protein M758_2G196600 [Ceratodon purpureus]|nr:hypothetical protein M758_2G196600 [Ceratodon purpureus]